jgi:hypothetical protein
MTIHEFVEKAIAGGWDANVMLGTDYAVRWPVPDVSEGPEAMEVHLLGDPTSIYLDPKAWEAVGVALGNKDEMRCDSPRCDTFQCQYAGYWPWRRHMIGLMEYLADDFENERRSVESYLATFDSAAQTIDSTVNAASDDSKVD